MDTDEGPRSAHVSVLYQQVLSYLKPQANGLYIDGTLGAGGHAAGILQASAPSGKLLGLDVDPQALEIAKQRLSVFSDRVVVRHASYVTLRQQMQDLGWQAVNGILLDLGASSMQFDTVQRGFSFQTEAELDMRFDPHNPLSAADLVNHLDEQELADIIYRYGEERRSRQIAHAIVRSRPIHTTPQLAAVVSRMTSTGKHGLHPATRTFQALRIAVNHELEALQEALPQALAALAPEGRLVVISFHSLEDRIVKQFFRQESRDCLCPPQQPICTCAHRATLRELTRRPLEADTQEVNQTPRSRSARLRAAFKTA